MICFYFYVKHISFFFLFSLLLLLLLSFFLPSIHPVQAELLSLRTGVSCLLCGHGGVLLCGAADGDGGRVATAGKDAEIRIWDTVSGECVEKLQGHTETVSALCFGRKTADLLVSGANDNTIKIWRREDGKLILFLSPVFMKKNYLFILFHYLFYFIFYLRILQGKCMLLRPWHHTRKTSTPLQSHQMILWWQRVLKTKLSKYIS